MTQPPVERKEWRPRRWVPSPVRRRELRKRTLFVGKLGVFATLLALEIFWPHWDDLLGVPGYYVRVGLIYFAVHMTISLIRLTFVFVYLRSNKYDWAFRDNLVIGANRIAYLLNTIALFISVLVLFDIHPRDFFTGISIFAAALAILFKEYVTNLLNGMILMFSRQLSVNDDVRIGHHRGHLKDINLINVSLINENGEFIYVPNNVVLATDVVNYSKTDRKWVMVEAELDLHKVTDLEKLRMQILAGLIEYDEHLKASAFRIEVVKVMKETLTVQIHAQLRRQNAKVHAEMKNAITQELIRAVYGIEA